ncbi:MAG: tryptophanase [Candidatus Izemoplasmatales bacterium]|jgi:tryptophanase|nr:tryptophanase [Candidatus Izemoplasmatales bacterium]MDD4595175.1 tryptophanase [Candidatus Izemoplasmatales bacterium]
MDKKYAVPPYKIKMVEPIHLIGRSEREERLAQAGYNQFALKSEDVFIDLLTDSGTGAMSHFQWGAMMIGDEAYAGSQSFYRLETAVKNITGYAYIMPAHQGRGAEQVVIPQLIKHPGMIFISNMHFDTTRAHVELAGGEAVDVACKECLDTLTYYPFKGNFDLEKLEKVIISRGKDNVAGIILTVTNNAVGGQPVSMENFRSVCEIAKKYQIKTIIDGARYAENSYFIKIREKGYENTSVREIAKEMFGYADIFLMSAKKDGLVNMGGIIAIKDDQDLFRKCQTYIVPMEGFPTYGGMAGRDMDALAVGLDEALDEAYLEYRIDEVRYLGDRLKAAGIPIQFPTGGHAVFVDCGKMCPHIPYDQFPAAAVGNELYIEGGIRSVEIGSMLMGRDPISGKNRQSDMELLRLTIPRRVYTFQHWDYVADSLINVFNRRQTIKGLKFTYESPVLRHFTSRFVPMP